MDGQQGIENTKKAITGALKLGALLYKAFQDGVQTEDIAAIWAKLEADPSLKQAILDAYNSADKVGPETAELSTAEAIELAIHVLSEASKVYGEVK